MCSYKPSSEAVATVKQIRYSVPGRHSGESAAAGAMSDLYPVLYSGGWECEQKVAFTVERLRLWRIDH